MQVYPFFFSLANGFKRKNLRNKQQSFCDNEKLIKLYKSLEEKYL